MRIWLVLISNVAIPAMALAAPRVCVRQGSSIGLGNKMVASVRAAVSDTLATRAIEVGCRNPVATLEVSALRVGSSLRTNFRLLRKKKELAAGFAMADAATLDEVRLPEPISSAIEKLLPPPPRPPPPPPPDEPADEVTEETETVTATPIAEVDAVEPQPSEPLATSRETEGVWNRHHWGWTAVGIGSAVLVAAGVSGVLAMSKNSELSDLCPNNECNPNDPEVAAIDIDAENRILHQRALAFDILLPIGVVAVAGGVLLLTVFAEEDPPAVAVSPWAGRHSAGAVVRAQF